MSSARSARSRTLPLSAFHSEVGGGAPDVAAPDELPRGPVEGGGVAHPGSRGHAELLESNAAREPSAISTGGASSVSLDTFKSAVDLCLREFLGVGGACIGHCAPLACNLLRFTPRAPLPLPLPLPPVPPSTDVVEAARCIDELGAPEWHLHIVKRGVTLAMDRGGREREMIAVLLAALHARALLSSEQVCAGFSALVEGVDDLQLDIPSAPALLSHFLADAHLDGLLPLDALAKLDAAAPGDAARAVLADARRRLAGRVPLGGSQLDKRQVRAAVRRVLEEYLHSRDVAEVRRRLDELAVPADLQHQTVRAAIELGIERRDPERELVSRLLSSLHEEGPAYLSAAEAARGFEQLLERLDDLAIDNPRAPELLAAFLTRAVADEVLVLAFVGAAAPGVSETQLACLSAARAPLAASHFGERRRHVWGAATDGTLEALKRAIAALCDEYFVSGELAEAVRCVEELRSPNYHHELVKRLVGFSIVDGGPRELTLAVQLSARLSDKGLLHAEQLALGCSRLLEALPDMQLDRPRAPEVLADFLDQCCEGGHLQPRETWHTTATRLRIHGGRAVTPAEATEPAELH